MATLATQIVDNDGLTPAYVAAAGGGDRVSPGDGAYIHVKNGGGAPITVTLVTPAVVDATLAVGDRAVVIANASEAKIRVPAELYRDPADGLAGITYSGVTTVTIGSFRV